MVNSGAVLLDVRTPAEFSSGHVEGAKHIPVAELKTRIEELDAETPVVVYCRSGRRSHQAAVVLQARGFAVANMGSLSDWPD